MSCNRKIRRSLFPRELDIKKVSLNINAKTHMLGQAPSELEESLSDETLALNLLIYILFYLFSPENNAKKTQSHVTKSYKIYFRILLGSTLLTP